MTDTDTRAALDAAILKYGGDAAASYEFHARPPDDRDLNAAITAHVEAEVTRRLAAADSVDEVASIERLRAAIAADRERAVEAAEHAAFILGRNAVLAHPDGCGLIARPAPDEARRLVEAHRRECELSASDRDPNVEAALLRALGVRRR